MKRIYASAIDLIGHTPLVELKNLERILGLEVTLLAKLEGMNPAGSAKDRVARRMIEEAEAKGILHADSVIIEPTSGNTGIGLAFLAAAKGYRAILVMPDTMSVERQKLLRAYGAEVVLSTGEKGVAGSIEKAEELAREIPHAYIPGQFTNPDNPAAHEATTGVEIWQDTEGKVDIFVAGIGTGGTITGTGRYLKKQKPDVQVIGIEPAGSPFFTKGYTGKHDLQGLGAGFCPATFDQSICDEIVPVEDEQAYTMARMLAKKEGLLVGISSGGALWAAVQTAYKKENRGKTIVALLTDTGERYLSTALFAE